MPWRICRFLSQNEIATVYFAKTVKFTLAISANMTICYHYFRRDLQLPQSASRFRKQAYTKSSPGKYPADAWQTGHWYLD